MKHVPTDLFEHALLANPWTTKLAGARRLMVTAWLLHTSVNEPSRPELITRARAVWDIHVEGLKRPGRVTVLTVLAQLKELGFVKDFDAVEGGYAVELAKEVA